MDSHDCCSSGGEDSANWNCDELFYDESESLEHFRKSDNDNEPVVLEDSQIVIETSTVSDENCSPVATISSGLDIASPEKSQTKCDGFGTPDDKASRIKTVKKRTPRTLSRMMKKHRESERNRHQGLNYGIIRLSRMVPGHNEGLRETKVVIMQRVIDYITFVETVVRSLSSEVGFDGDKCGLHLSSYLSEQQKDNFDIHPILTEACQFLEPIDPDNFLRKVQKTVLIECSKDPQQSGTRRRTVPNRFMRETDSEAGSSFHSQDGAGTSQSMVEQEEPQSLLPRKQIVRCTVANLPSDSSSFTTVSEAPNNRGTSLLTNHLPYHWRFHDAQANLPSAMASSSSLRQQERMEPPKKKKRVDISSRIDLRKTSWMNGFMMYSRINRKNYINDRPGVPTSVVSKLMGQAWRSMTEDEQLPYKEKAKSYAKYMLDAYKLPDDMMSHDG